MCEAEREAMTNNIQMNSLSLNSQILQSSISSSRQARGTSPQPVEITEDTSSQHGKVYAKEGDNNYNAEMDADGDGTVTYDEYMAYCEKNAVSQYTENPGLTVVERVQNSANSIQSIRPINIGKALTTYSAAEVSHPSAFITNEA